jgi:hypothetical protein
LRFIIGSAASLGMPFGEVILLDLDEIDDGSHVEE